MDVRFEHHLATRNHFIRLIEDLSTAQLNQVPAGFSNNIIWNIVHCITSQQGLTYGLSGLEQQVSKELALQYKNGTRPERDLSVEEIKGFKNILKSLIIGTATDYKEGRFKDFTEYTTSTGYTLRNIDEALHLVSIHEGIHLGYCLALKKVVLNEHHS